MQSLKHVFDPQVYFSLALTHKVRVGRSFYIVPKFIAGQNPSVQDSGIYGFFLLLEINPFTQSLHNNIKPPHTELSEFDIAELTFGTSCRCEWMVGN